MPRIKEYQSQVGAAGPIQVRDAKQEDFGANQAEGLTKLGAGLYQAGDALAERENQNETSKAHLQYSQLLSDYSKEVSEYYRTAKPNEDGTFDQEATAKIMEKYETKNQGILDGITMNGAKQYALKQGAEVKAHIFKQAFTGQMNLAGDQAVFNAVQAHTNTTSFVYNNPHDVDTALQMHEKGMERFRNSPGYSAEMEMKLKEKEIPEIWKASVEGWINSPNQGPEFALDQIRSGAYEGKIDADTLYKLQNQAETQIRVNEAHEAEKMSTLMDVDQKKLEEINTEIISNSWNGIPMDIKATTKRILDAGGTGEDVDHMIRGGLGASAVFDREKERHNFQSLQDRWFSDDPAVKKPTEREVYALLSPTGEYSRKAFFEMMKGNAPSDKRLYNQMQGAKKGILEVLKTDSRGAIANPNARLDADKVFASLEKKVATWKKEGRDLEPIFDPDSKDHWSNDALRAKTDATAMYTRNNLTIGGAAKAEEPPRIDGNRVTKPTPEIQLYNQMVASKKYGGTKDNMFGTNGELPKEINYDIAAKAKAEIARQQAEGADAARIAGIDASNKAKGKQYAEEKMKAQDALIKARNDMALKNLGLTVPTVEAPPPPEYTDPNIPAPKRIQKILTDFKAGKIK